MKKLQIRKFVEDAKRSRNRIKESNKKLTAVTISKFMLLLTFPSSMVFIHVHAMVAVYSLASCSNDEFLNLQKEVKTGGLVPQREVQ